MNPDYDPFDPMALRRPITGGGGGLAGTIADQIGGGGGGGYNQFASQGSPGRYYGGGNIGQSAPGSRSPTGNPVDPKNQFGFQGTYDQWRQSMVPEHPWMSDTSVQWGGGPQGYLPIGYQAQPFSYYQQRDAGGNVAQGPGVLVNTGRHTRWQPSGGYGQMAPWELQYAADTWTQNYDPNQPGYIGTRG